MTQAHFYGKFFNAISQIRFAVRLPVVERWLLCACVVFPYSSISSVHILHIAFSSKDNEFSFLRSRVLKIFNFINY